MGTDGELESFDWVRQSEIGQAGCLTLARTADSEAVARAFGGRVEQAREMSLDRIWAEFEGEPVVAVRRQGEWVVAVEDNGWQGSRVEVLRGLGFAVSAYWNVNALTRFSYARDGKVRTAFEAMAPNWRHGADPDCLEEIRAGLPWEDGDWVALMFALAARVTGQVVEPGWLKGEFTVYPVVALVSDVRDEMDPQYQSLTYQEPLLGYAVRTADDVSLRAVASAASEYVTEVCEIGEVVEADLDERIRWATHEASEIGPTAWPVIHALEAVRALRSASPMAAAFQALYAAGSAFAKNPEGRAELNRRAMAALGDPVPPRGSAGIVASPEWITGHWLAPAAIVTYVRTTDIHAVAAVFGSESHRGPVELSDTSQAALRVDGEWVVAIEFGEPMRNLQEQLKTLSADTTVVCVQWCARGNTLFYHYESGESRAVFRPYGEVPDSLVSHVEVLGEPVQGNGSEQAPWLLALARRLTTVSLEPESLDEEHLVVKF
jgi:hypothetical protein